MIEITKDMTISEIIALDRGCAEVFFRCGMYCVGCPHSAGESLEAACAGHGIPLEGMLSSLNEYFADKEKA